MTTNNNIEVLFTGKWISEGGKDDTITLMFNSKKNRYGIDFESHKGGKIFWLKGKELRQMPLLNSEENEEVVEKLKTIIIQHTSTSSFVARERETAKNKSYSKNVVDTLMENYINDDNHISEDVKFKGTENRLYMFRTRPVKNFKKIFVKFAMSLGIPKAEAEDAVNNYAFDKSDVTYVEPFMNEFLYQYLRTNRKYQLFNKEDLTASVKLKFVEAKDKEKEDGTKVHTEDHFELVKSSSCPKWKKYTTDSAGKSLNELVSLIVEDLD